MSIFTMQSNEKMNNPLWQRKRLKIMERDDFCCQLCGDGSSSLFIHFKRYIKGAQPWEFRDCDLTTVCFSCRQNARDLVVSTQEFMASLPIDSAPGSVQDVLALIHAYTAQKGHCVDSEIYCDEQGGAIGSIALAFSNIGFQKIIALKSLVDKLGARAIFDAAKALSHSQESSGGAKCEITPQ